MENPKYIDDNYVFKYSIYLKNNLLHEIVYTKPFPEPPTMSSTEQHELKDYKANLVLGKYFTKEKIEELKQKFIKEIQESENPFNIYCVDIDGGYNIKEEELFNLD